MVLRLGDTLRINLGTNYYKGNFFSQLGLLKTQRVCYYAFHPADTPRSTILLSMLLLWKLFSLNVDDIRRWANGIKLKASSKTRSFAVCLWDRFVFWRHTAF